MVWPNSLYTDFVEAQFQQYFIYLYSVFYHLKGILLLFSKNLQHVFEVRKLLVNISQVGN